MYGTSEWRSTRATIDGLNSDVGGASEEEGVEQRAGNHLVVRRRRHHPVEVAVLDARRCARRRAGRRRQPQVVAGGDHPGGVAASGHAALHPPCEAGERRLTSQVGGEVRAENDCGLGGDGHALAVDRVERAHAVADDDEAVRPATQALEVAPAVGRVGEGDRGRQRFGEADGVVEDRAAQRPGEADETAIVDRRGIAAGSLQRDHPAITLDREHHTHPRSLDGAGLDEDPSPSLIVEDRTRPPAIRPRGVRNSGVDARLGRPLVPELLEPLDGPAATARGVDDEVGPQDRPVTVLAGTCEAHAAHTATVARWARARRP